MAKAPKAQKVNTKRPSVKKRTSIGKSTLSRPKNKSKRASFKKYRGQGRQSYIVAKYL